MWWATRRRSWSTRGKRRRDDRERPPESRKPGDRGEHRGDSYDVARRPGQGRRERPSRLRGVARLRGDRKSTRLNSSHANISYAVFCLKKKKKKKKQA